MAVDVLTEPTFQIGTPKILFELPDATLAFDASLDGKRFLITQPAEAPQQSSVMKQKPTSKLLKLTPK